ncbi:MAG: Sulfurtransferase TusA [Pseudomonadota bacterium]|jgi:tRNA 2-thiouridine synthesizing protein A
MTDSSSALPEASAQLDACGLYCPEPVMLLHNCIRDMASGEVVEVIATDPSTTRDVPKFCLFLGHELLARTQTDDRYHYWIRKA